MLPLINGLSDRNAQIIEISNLYYTNPSKQYKYTRKFDNDTMLTFTNLLSYELWDQIFTNQDINLIFNNFLNIYLKIYNASFPVIKRKECIKSNTWITAGIKKSCNNKRYLYMRCRESKELRHKIHYKKYCKVLSAVIRDAKQKYYNTVIQKSNNKTRATWNIVKSITNNTPPNKKPNTVDFKKNNTSAKIFNHYFSTIAEQLNRASRNEKISNKTKDPIEFLNLTVHKPNNKIRLENTTTHEIYKIIHSLKTKDSHGYDGISTKILKVSAPYIVSPLTYITNRILSSSVFPDRLKYSEIIPVYKNGNTEDLTNYRPISLLTAFSKIIEKVLYKRIYHFFEQQQLFVKEQHGFRQGTSTESATFSLFNTIEKSLDNKKTVGGLFLDLSKAFDCVDHNILLSKLNFYGISGKNNKLMKSYITSRYQRVVVKDKFSNSSISEWRQVKYGVPQGSILGPLLFLIYINDMPRTIESCEEVILFADDTSIIIANTNIQEFKHNIKKAIQEINNWFLSNSLTINYNKTHFLQFFTKQQKEIPLQIMTTNSILTNINSTKFLGLTIDSGLSWKEHIMSLMTKLNRACFAIRAIKPFLSRKVQRIVYHSYFHSIMTYGIIFWGTSCLHNNIFKIQKRMIRILSNKTKRDSCRQLYKQLQILTLTSQYIYSLLIFVNKYRECFLTNYDIHGKTTRYNLNLHIPTTNLKIAQKGVFYSGIKIFNHLPMDIKSSFIDPKRFKVAVKRFLLNHTLYSLNEYYELTSK